MFVEITESIPQLSLVLVFLLTILYVKVAFRRNPRHVSFASKLRGPPGWPLIGHSFDFWYGGTEGIQKLSEYGRQYGSLYRVWFGKHLFVVVSDTEILETVFRNSRTQDKPDIFLTSFRRFQGDAISTCPIDIWRQTRKRVQPLYGKKELVKYMTDVSGIVQKCVGDMDRLCDGPEFSICDKLQEITFSAITKPNFNVEFHSDELSELTIGSCNKIFSEICFLTMFRSWFHVPLLYNLRYYWTERRIKKDMRTFTRMVLEKNEEFFAGLKKNLQGEERTRESSASASFLSVLHQMQDETMMNETWLHDQIAFFTVAGTDGMAIMMSFFLISIASNPAIQRKLQEELDDVFDDDRETSIADLDRLVYLDQALKETHRRYTFLPLLFRSVDVDMKIGTQIFPAGTSILINADQIHHDPKYYPHPYAFNPDNFSPEAVSKRPAVSFIPFSFGPRNCLAAHYATFVMKLTLVQLLRRFQFETTLSEGIKINVGFITTCSSGYNVRIKRRRGSEEKNDSRRIVL